MPKSTAIVASFKPMSLLTRKADGDKYLAGNEKGTGQRLGNLERGNLMRERSVPKLGNIEDESSDFDRVIC